MLQRSHVAVPPVETTSWTLTITVSYQRFTGVNLIPKQSTQALIMLYVQQHLNSLAHTTALQQCRTIA